MKPTKQIQMFIDALRAGAPAGAVLRRLDVPAKLREAAREELGIAEGGEVQVDGVVVLPLDPRVGLLELARQYAIHRWHVAMSTLDVSTLFGAVPDDELEDLIPIVIDQHMDDHGYEDPADKMDYRELEELKGQLAELGYVDVEI